jgi:CBS domain-containing protein
MTTDVQVIAPRATIEQAARTMGALDIGALPVCDGDRLAGLVTDRDITVRATAAGRDPSRTAVGEVMTRDLSYVRDSHEVDDAAQLMQEQQIRRLPVVDAEHRLVGVVSLGDLGVKAPGKSAAGAVLKRVSEPARPDR